MAKKVSIEEYKKKNNSKKNKKYFIAFLITIFILSISIIANIILIVNIFDLNNQLEEEKNKPELVENDIVTDQDIYNENKLNFFDQNIVFVVSGDNHYYSYDCLKKQRDDMNFKGNVYHISVAKNQGYIEGTC